MKTKPLLIKKNTTYVVNILKSLQSQQTTAIYYFLVEIFLMEYIPKT